MKVFNLTKRSSFDLLLCAFSVLLVVFAPSEYSFDYCLFLHNLFLSTFLLNVYKHRKEGLLTFNMLFSISFYYTSFFYPVFIYNTPDRYFSMFEFHFDENIISYSTAVAYSAYCFLQLGLNNAPTYKKTINKIDLKHKFGHKNLDKRLNILSTLFAIFLAYFIVNGGTGFFANQFIYSMSEQDIFMGYIVQFITPLAYAMLLLSFLLPKKKSFSFMFAIVLISIYVVLILSTGSRTIPMFLIIIALFMYNDFIKKLSPTKLAIVGLTCITIFITVGSLRGEGETITMEQISSEGSEALMQRTENSSSFANELIINNRNLYYLIGSTETYGYTYGATLLGSFLGMIPFMQGLFIRVTGLPVYILNSATYNTVMSLGRLGIKGLGTHAVADIYICWGIIGVLLVFYLYGYVITKCKLSRQNIYYSVAYYILISNAIYGCRASILNLRSIIWTIGVVYLVLNFPLGKRYNY